VEAVLATIVYEAGDVRIKSPPYPAVVGDGAGPAPVRAFIDELLPDILDGRIQPGRVFDRTVGLAGVHRSADRA
jgi:hypothetical protein